ncbi:APH(3') family aminoglycoside O-phosphotransferase [Labrys sp. La1]|uniref:APH(3') family aminoglycoside O-phosphotransferase n=1 Tax=Labrys sp. La1 TaxID=3404917 RepID=UPI003EBF93B8
MKPALDIPADWRGDLKGYGWKTQSAGASGAGVFRLEAPGKPDLFVKTEELSSLGELPDEGPRLEWLSARGILCPKPLAEARHGGRHWLLMSAIPGAVLSSRTGLTPEQAVDIAADALRHLHALDIADCPFDHCANSRIALAEARVKAGLVDEEDFDEERTGQTAADVFAELQLQRPRLEELVVTHGDATLENLLADKGAFSGFIDCARAGLADRHQDLALATRSIRDRFGAVLIERFFARYGITPDPDRMAFYLLLDEFF